MNGQVIDLNGFQKCLLAYAILLQEVINASVANVLSENPGLRYFRLINGYRRFDPTRGMDYILDLLFRTPSDGDVLQRRVNSY